MDVYFQPSLVIEVQCAQISNSKLYALDKGDRGVSLRFPRFLRIRDDKKVEDITQYSDLVWTCLL